MIRRRARLLSGCGLLLLVPGCGGDARPSDSATAEELGLSAVAVYGRHAAVRGKVDVRVANAGERPVEVERFQVRHPMFEPLPPTARGTTLPADADARIVPVPFGAPRCGVREGADAVVVLGVRTARGVQDVAVPLADGQPGLLRAHRLVCDADAVRAATSVSLGPRWTRRPGTPAALRTTLRLDRRGRGAVQVVALDGNILFSVDLPGPAPLPALGPDQESASTPVDVTATRCDPHALTESKRSFTFPVRVRLDGGEPVLVDVTVDADGRRALQSLLEATCPALGASASAD